MSKYQKQMHLPRNINKFNNPRLINIRYVFKYTQLETN